MQLYFRVQAREQPTTTPRKQKHPVIPLRALGASQLGGTSKRSCDHDRSIDSPLLISLDKLCRHRSASRSQIVRQCLIVHRLGGANESVKRLFDRQV